MKITQKRAIERRLSLRDASYQTIAREMGVGLSSVEYIAREAGHRRQALFHLQIMVRAQERLLQLRKSQWSTS